MRVVVTGAYGFLGWHVRARLLAAGDFDVVPVGRDRFADGDALAAALVGADAVVHIAGVNRGTPAQITRENIALADKLVESIDKSGGTPHVVYTNSVQALDARSPYGTSKAVAAESLARWAARSEGRFSDIVLPNLFGEHGQPNYNSVVATFCHAAANRQRPIVHDPTATVELLHAQDAAQIILEAIVGTGGRRRPRGVPIAVAELAATLERFAGAYTDANVPARAGRLERRLFNAYRSALWPQRVPIGLACRADARGGLVEAVRTPVGPGQAFVSTTVPEQVRGEHFHFDKFERFVVLRGTAEIRLRRVLHSGVVRFNVSGAEPAAVDMPTLWAHSITNVGHEELVTLFWTDELYDITATDTYPDSVDAAGPPTNETMVRA